jgi:hypothetical protein
MHAWWLETRRGVADVEIEEKVLSFEEEEEKGCAMFAVQCRCACGVVVSRVGFLLRGLRMDPCFMLVVFRSRGETSQGT